MKVLAFSIITDLGVIGKIVEVSHEEVQEAAKCSTQDGRNHAHHYSTNLTRYY